MTNKALVQSLVSGSEKAFRTVFDKFYQGLVRFAHSYVEDFHVAENLVQDAFVLLWERRQDLTEDSNLQAYLVKVVKLKAWNYIEKQRNRIAIEKSIYDDSIKELNLKLYTLDALETVSIYLADISEIIEKTLLTLPEQTRIVFYMSRQEGLSNREIAEKLNLSVKSVEYHITKTLKQLKLPLLDYIKSVILLLNLQLIA
jgi:RNA polymerase sigma-70 factor (ECF subfamily)